jgi:hypothetical protein
MTQQLEARNATLEDLVALLKQQHDAKVDFVTPLVNVRSEGGILAVDGTGVIDAWSFRPTSIADGHLAEKLGIPTQYLRRMRSERVDLYDANVNGWIGGFDPEHVRFSTSLPASAPDDRSVLLRTFQSDDGGPGVLRALLSDRYGIVDNLDVLTAALAGVRDTGTETDVVFCDLSETRMRMRIAAPEIFVNSPELMKGYRNPFTESGQRGVLDHSEGRVNHWGRGGLPQKWQDKYGVDSDGVFAGIEISNSETGGGAFQIVPVFTVLRCTNGLLFTQEALRRVHLGSKLQEGTINWSKDTERKALELITAQTRDAVTAFLDHDFVEMMLDSIARKVAEPLSNAQEAIEYVAKKLAFSEETTAGVLDHFIRGGQVTAGGVMQAVTSYAQTVESPDAAFELESNAMKALELAYAAA